MMVTDTDSGAVHVFNQTAFSATVSPDVAYDMKQCHVHTEHPMT